MSRTLELPMIRFNAQLPGSTFYLGVAVNDSNCVDEMIPEYVEDLFVRLGMPLNQYERGMWPQRGLDIEQFLQGVSEYDHLTSPLHFEPFVSPALPSNLSEAEEIEAVENRAAYDHLLWWCSSKGAGSVSQLSELSAELGLNDLEGGVWAVIKKLSLLGHLDVTPDRDREWHWRVAPLTVVEPVSGQPAYLAGAISGRSLQRLSQTVGLALDGTNGGPSRMIVAADRVETLQSVLSFVPRRVTSASDRWAELLPPLDQWQATLVHDPDLAAQPHQYTFERYSGNHFQPVNGSALGPGFYRVQRDGQQFVKHVLRTADERWLNGDYATLRFLSLSLVGLPPQAQLHADGTLVVPLLQRWPTLYERPLVLASGQLPSTRVVNPGATRLLAYSGVPKVAAEQLAKKLNVQLSS